MSALVIASLIAAYAWLRKLVLVSSGLTSSRGTSATISALNPIVYVYDIPDTTGKTNYEPTRRPHTIVRHPRPIRGPLLTLSELLDPQALGALASVIIIDVTLAGDNAVVVGMAAAGLDRADQRRVIALGIAVATILRIGFAIAAVRLLTIIGLTLAGG